MGILVDATWWKIDSPITLVEQAAAPDTPNASQLALYAKSDGLLYFKNDAGTEYNLGLVGGAALTASNDTNVTLALGGSPTTALLTAASLTLGWTGTLGVARGGTNIASYTTGDLLYASGATTLAKLADVAAGQYLRSGGIGVAPAWLTIPASEIGSGAAVTAASTKITLAGSPSAAALAAFSIDVNQANLDHGSIGGLGDDDHTQYRLESADHSHQSTGLQAGQLDHGLALTGLTDDDHTGYALLAGRAAGQILYGGNAANDDLRLEGTSHATKTTSFVLLQPNGGKVGIGLISPQRILHVYDAVTAQIWIEAATGDLNAGVNIGTYTHQATPALTSTEHFYQFNFDGTDDVFFTKMSAMPTTVSTRLDSVVDWLFYTKNSGSSNPAEAMRITGAGNVVIGTTLAAAKLHTDQASTTGAIPVLLLDQADLDQPFIEFVTTIGTGNAIEAVGAKVLTTTHFVMVKIPGGLTRYFPIGTIA